MNTLSLPTVVGVLLSCATPGRRDDVSAMLVVIQSQYLSLHFYHLHMYSHPRFDTNLLEAMLLALIWRVILHNYFQDLNVSGGVAHKLRWVIRLIWHLPLLFWLYYASRSYLDAFILVLFELSRMVWLREAHTLLKDSLHDSQICCLLFTSAEAAFVVGILPIVLTRHDEILHEHGESLRITFLVLANCLVLSTLNYLNAYNAVLASTPSVGRLTSFFLPPEHGGASASLNLSALMWPVSEAAILTPQQLQQRTPTSKLERRSKGAKDAPTPPHSPVALAAESGYASRWLALYEQNADRAHLGLISVQSAVVCVMLIDFMHTPHWRAHAIALLCNFVILYACIAFRKQACVQKSA